MKKTKRLQKLWKTAKQNFGQYSDRVLRRFGSHSKRNRAVIGDVEVSSMALSIKDKNLPY